ncbi:MAG: VWA domain-containing protein [candidate division SR1 bacterium]|nr:VWA domain-containing protein [candidate division SR1 bacterium]
MVLVCIILLPLHLGFVSGKTLQIQKSTPVQIMLDVSLSMAATDIPPSRFSVAKSYLVDAVHHLQGYDVSLITFSGIPFISLPFSHDTPAIVQSLQTMSLADFPAAPEFLGTALGDALVLGAANIHRLSADQPGMVLLITDGDNNKGYDPADIFSLLQKQHIAVRVLAIGQTDYLIGYDQYQQPIVTSLNIPLLQTIAQQTSGTFLNVINTGDLQPFFASFLSAVKANEISHISSQYRYLDEFLLIFLFISLLVLGFMQVIILSQYLKNK